MAFKINRVQRLSAVIAISLSFFVAEISVGFYTHSLALVADAFHYFNDIVGFIIALVAVILAEKNNPPQTLTFGWQRAQLLGAFFNGVLLFGLGISVFLQSIERFISLDEIYQPKLVMIMGCVGFGLNVISVLFLHEHDHDHSRGPDREGSQDAIELRDEKHIHHKHSVKPVKKSNKKPGLDLAMMGVLIHVLGDCANNLGVIIAGLVIWLTHYGGRFYADPAVSMAISAMIFASSIPLIKRSGIILLQSAPDGVDHDDVKHDLQQIQGVHAVHELYIWQLNQKRTVASAHILLEDASRMDFDRIAKTINECLHEYGIHSVTLQPETWSGTKVCHKLL